MTTSKIQETHDSIGLKDKLYWKLVGPFQAYKAEQWTYTLELDTRQLQPDPRIVYRRLINRVLGKAIMYKNSVAIEDGLSIYLYELPDEFFTYTDKHRGRALPLTDREKRTMLDNAIGMMVPELMETFEGSARTKLMDILVTSFVKRRSNFFKSEGLASGSFSMDDGDAYTVILHDTIKMLHARIVQLEEHYLM